MKYLTLFAVIALMISCKKKDDPQPVTPAPSGPPPVTTELANGLPGEPQSIDAYFYAGYKRDVSYMSEFNQSMFSVLGTSSRNLMANYDRHIDQPTFVTSDQRGNVDIGDVTFSGNTIAKSASPTNSQYFTSTLKTNTTTAAVWETPKGGRFGELSITIERGYPQITVPMEYHISVSEGFALKISNYISNYDSVSFHLASNQTGSSGFSIAKKFGKTADSVIFTPSDLAGAYPNYQHLFLNVSAYNYSNKTISNLKYVFELSNKVTNKPFSLGF